MLPFEIRDMNFDDLKLSTIPQKIGLFNTKKLAYFGILVLVFFLFFKNNTSRVEIISTSTMLMILCVFIVKSRPQNSYYYTAFWVEALPIFWWLMSISLEILHESGTL
jgi:phosphoglycerol transferase MdoB-like AlkP superfamily enzyme